jgi:pimeloyl-ACP methyl ester carboxylesterase
MQWNVPHACQIPALVIHGQDDKVIGTTGGQHLHENLGNAMGELLVIPETSHQVFQEKPDQVAEFILKFINQVIQ